MFVEIKNLKIKRHLIQRLHYFETILKEQFQTGDSPVNEGLQPASLFSIFRLMPPTSSKYPEVKAAPLKQHGNSLLSQ